MRHRQIFVLWGLWLLILWLVASDLDITPESASQEQQMASLSWQRNWTWVPFRKSSCPSGTRHCSSCHHAAGEWDWFQECHKKTTGYLRRNKVLWQLVMSSVSELGKAWKKLLDVIPRPLVRHFDVYCGTCAVLGNSQILRGSGLSNTDHMVLRMNQAPVQGSKAESGNRTIEPFICPRNARNPGSWTQLPLLLELLDLMWTSGALTDKVRVGFGEEQQRKRPHCWTNNETRSLQEILPFQSTEADMKTADQPGQAHCPRRAQQGSQSYSFGPECPGIAALQQHGKDFQG